jgi:hypothetical protein
MNTIDCKYWPFLASVDFGISNVCWSFGAERNDEGLWEICSSAELKSIGHSRRAAVLVCAYVKRTQCLVPGDGTSRSYVHLTKIA